MRREQREKKSPHFDKEGSERKKFKGKVREVRAKNQVRETSKRTTRK